MIERLHPEMRASARLLSLADRRREIKHVATPAIFGEAKTSESVSGMILPTWIAKVVVHRLADNHLFRAAAEREEPQARGFYFGC